MGKKYVGEETLEALMQIMKDELAKKVSAEELGNLDSIKETITEIQKIKEQLEEVIGEDGGVENAKNAEKAADSDKLGGEDANAYAKVAQLADYLKTDDLISELTALEDLDDEDRATASAKLVKALYDKVVAFEDALRDSWDEEVENVVEDVLSELKGQQNGLATLDDSGKVPADQLPSYVDDVIDFYVEDTSDEKDGSSYKYYGVTADGAKNAEDEITTGERGKIYVDVVSGMSYRWSGSKFVEISSGLVEMDEDEVQAIWDKVVAAAAAGDDEEEEDEDQQAAD